MASAAAAALCVQSGANIIRTHNVGFTRDAVSLFSFLAVCLSFFLSFSVSFFLSFFLFFDWLVRAQQAWPLGNLDHSAHAHPHLGLVFVFCVKRE